MVNNNMDDEIDLFELFKTLWNGKWWVVSFIFISMLFGVAYIQVLKPSYQVSIFYNIYNEQFCDLESNSNCIENSTIGAVLNEINMIKGIDKVEDTWKWDAKKKHFNLVTESPLTVDEYREYFEQISTEVTLQLRQQAKLDYDFIQNNLNAALQSTEYAALNIVDANRILHAVDNGEIAIAFSLPLIEEKTKRALALCLSMLLGAMLGICVVLIRHSFIKYKASQLL